MDSFTPLKTKNKKKKANKFLIIGNLLLAVIVAGIGFFYYNNTLITTQQKAGFDCGTKDKRECEAAKREYEDSGKKDADREAKKKKEQEERRLEREEIGGGSCPGGYETCEVSDTGGQSHRFCLDETKKKGCYNEAVDRGITVKTGEGVGSDSAEQGGWICEFGKNNYSGGPCLKKNSVKTIGNQKPPACFCGVIQIDGGQWDGTYQSSCDCDSKEQEVQTTTTIVGTIVPTQIPTATPVISNTPTATPIISNTPTVTPLISNTPTVTPLISNTPGPSATPIPILCGTKDCDNKTNPCRSGYSCVQAKDGSNYCTSPDFANTCKANPSYNNCCTAPGAPTATPTEIILAKISTSPTVVKLLETGMVKSFMYLIPAAIILIGLIL